MTGYLVKWSARRRSGYLRQTDDDDDTSSVQFVTRSSENLHRPLAHSNSSSSELINRRPSDLIIHRSCKPINRGSSVPALRSSRELTHQASDDLTCSGSTYSSKQYDSLRKLEPGNLPPDEEHLGAPWYQAGVPREVVLELLGQEEIGSFIVRDSGTHPGCYALSVKVPKFDNPAGISHYLIMRTSRGGYRLKGLEKEWSSLTALVTHHTVMPEMLPCTLRLPRKASNFGFRDCDRDDKDEDDDYQRLSDFSHMMHDLKL